MLLYTRRAPTGETTAGESIEIPLACASRWRTVAPGGPAGSSSETASSSTATSTAYAVSSLDTDASRNVVLVGPAPASSVPSAAITAAEAVVTGQASIAPSAAS